MSSTAKTIPGAHRVRQFALAFADLPGVRPLVERLQPARLDLAIILALTMAAAIPRLVLLTDIPPGLHGDEAWTGLDARRILNEGWIGPYVGSALGQPTGPLYFAAPFVGILGDTVFAVRLSMALLAIVTIPVAYLTFRVMFDRPLAVFAAIFLAFGLWHLHYSRIGFMVISWPLMELLTLLFLFWGLKTGRWLYYALAGLAFGAGIYTYNAYPVFIAPVALIIVWLGLRHRREEMLAFAARIALMAGMTLFAALPMILYATDSDHDYLIHHRGVSILESDEWTTGDLADKGQLLFDRTRNFVTSAYWNGEPDGADGAGTEAMVDRLSVLLLILGAAIFLWRWRQPAAVAVLVMVALLPFASVLSFNALFRRSLGIVPFLAVLAAAPLALWWDRATLMSFSWRIVSYTGIAVVIAVVAYLNLNTYFGEFRDAPIARFTFGQELTEASEYMASLPGEPYVYFYSERWGFNYETRRYLAANVEGEDRSGRFGTFSLERDRGGAVAYVFLAPYLEQADEVAERYPGGASFESVDDDGAIQFRGYFLSQDEAFVEPVATAEPPSGPTATPGPGAGDRDAVRELDLAVIAQALEQYREQTGAYPDTAGQVQTICVFEVDVGCELHEVLDPVPLDPLPDATRNGYWYAGTKTEFTVYAQRESDALPECPGHPDHLGAFDSLYCVSGP